jgi:hypothetical protein
MMEEYYRQERLRLAKKSAPRKGQNGGTRARGR